MGNLKMVPPQNQINQFLGLLFRISLNIRSDKNLETAKVNTLKLYG